MAWKNWPIPLLTGALATLMVGAIGDQHGWFDPKPPRFEATLSAQLRRGMTAADVNDVLGIAPEWNVLDGSKPPDSQAQPSSHPRRAIMWDVTKAMVEAEPDAQRHSAAQLQIVCHFDGNGSLDDWDYTRTLPASYAFDSP